MIEKILKIEEVDDERYGGYRITTNKQEINILINNCQDCCEEWGWITSEDDLDKFVGAKLLKIERVDMDKNVTEFDPQSLDEGGAIFINLDTNKGLLQFVVYNCHNGYYGHDVKISSNQINIEEIL